jgi:hypothetical protein
MPFYTLLVLDSPVYPHLCPHSLYSLLLQGVNQSKMSPFTGALNHTPSGHFKDSTLLVIVFLSYIISFSPLPFKTVISLI